MQSVAPAKDVCPVLSPDRPPRLHCVIHKCHLLQHFGAFPRHERRNNLLASSIRSLTASVQVAHKMFYSALETSSTFSPSLGNVSSAASGAKYVISVRSSLCIELLLLSYSLEVSLL
mmetsp:Transcript_87373/g.195641  ORF Transcript_87373/g.195641 Transcript_87373/m.195641 type:complete len:117 (-) Transcript_87373:68-418(-)